MSRNELGEKLVEYSSYAFLRLGVVLLIASLYYWIGDDALLLSVILGLGAVLIVIPIVGFIGVIMKVLH